MALSRPGNLTTLLDKIERKALSGGNSSMSVGEVMDTIGRRAYGPLLLIIGVMSVSPLALIPGSTWIFALLTLLVAAQMALNLKHPWLPASALRLSFPQKKIVGALKKVRPWTAGIDRIVKPRLEFLAGEPWIILVALLAIAAALVTFPLSLIPFAPAIPGATVILVGLGVTARDGVVLAFAMAAMAAKGVWLASWFD